MRSIAKNRKQRSTYLPISIKLVAKIVLAVLGFHVWGTGFIWAFIGLYLFLPVLRGILSVIVGFVAIILLILSFLTLL